MLISEVSDSTANFEDSKPLEVGDHIVIQGLKVKYVEQYGSDIAEIKTTEGLRHSFAKAVVGTAKSEKVHALVDKCLEKDASDGLDCWVVQRIAEGTGRPMIALEFKAPKQ
jgi:hypothetical protein